MTPDSFQVLLVPFPFSDRRQEKWRPAVVVSNLELWRETGVFWAAMITSSDRFRLASDVDITDAAVAGLHVPSRVRTSKLATMTTRRVARTIGVLNSTDSQAVAAQIRGNLSSPNAA